MCLTLDQYVEIALSQIVELDLTEGRRVEFLEYDDIYLAKLKLALYNLDYTYEHTQDGFFVWKED